MALLTHIMAELPLPTARVWGTVPPAVPHGPALTFTFLLGRQNHRHLWAVSHLLPPWAQPSPFVFSSHYFRQLLAWEPQPGHATTPFLARCNWVAPQITRCRQSGAFPWLCCRHTAGSTLLQPLPTGPSALPKPALAASPAALNRVRPSLAPTGMSGAQQSTLTGHRACKPKSYKTVGL